MFSVGLTGGIASGKTTISNLFSALGVPVIDTDVISRQLLEPGETGYDHVVAHFGDEILADDGRIDRARLRHIVFDDLQQKNWLESMLHPLIFQRSHEAILHCGGASYVLVVIPLLFETNFQALIDRILVVDCPRELQLARLLERDNIDESLANKMLDQQLSNAERVARGHDIIENSDGVEPLESRVLELHRKYLQLAETSG